MIHSEFVLNWGKVDIKEAFNIDDQGLVVHSLGGSETAEMDRDNSDNEDDLVNPVEEVPLNDMGESMSWAY